MEGPSALVSSEDSDQRVHAEMEIPGPSVYYPGLKEAALEPSLASYTMLRFHKAMPSRALWFGMPFLISWGTLSVM